MEAASDEDVLALLRACRNARDTCSARSPSVMTSTAVHPDGVTASLTVVTLVVGSWRTGRSRPDASAVSGQQPHWQLAKCCRTGSRPARRLCAAYACGGSAVQADRTKRLLDRDVR